MELMTDGLRLVPMTELMSQLLSAGRRDLLAEHLGARVGDDWPGPDLASALETVADEDGWGAWIIIDGDSVAGDVGFHGPPHDGEVQLGYALRRAFQGKGHATRSVRALVAWALDDERVERVIARTLPENAASQRVLRRAGFVPDGDGLWSTPRGDNSASHVG